MDYSRKMNLETPLLFDCEIKAMCHLVFLSLNANKNRE